MFTVFAAQGREPWNELTATAHPNGALWRLFQLASGRALIPFVLLLGAAEFLMGRYGDEWHGNERTLEIVCFLLPRLLFAPFFAWVSCCSTHP